MSDHSPSLRINKISLFLNILLIIITGMAIFSSAIYDYFFQGHLEETVLTPRYPEKYHNKTLYVYTYKYKHLKGNSINDSSFVFRVMNTGSEIIEYDPYFKTLFNTKGILQIQDKNFVKLEIPLIRPGDEFDINIFTQNIANLQSTVVMKNGRLSSTDSNIWLQSPTLWIVLLMSGFFLLIIIYYKRTFDIINEEKQRIIGERNALQQIILGGERKSAKRRKK